MKTIDRERLIEAINKKDGRTEALKGLADEIGASTRAVYTINGIDQPADARVAGLSALAAWVAVLYN